MEITTPWLAIAIAIILTLSAASEKAKGKPGSTGSKSRYPSSPWAKGFEPQGSELFKWLAKKIPGIEPFLTNNENNHTYPYATDKTMSYEDTDGVEATDGVEGTAGIEGTAGVEGTAGIEGTSGDEKAIGVEEIGGTIESPLSAAKKHSSESKLTADIPNNEDLIRAIVWAEILDKPKALKGRR
ncbi:hypothetical protein [Desulfitobacterium sp.]|uniref:hypothetical protein n=1 Tax=Desulfitobacterium sp. TaxID=49981 RepID=UPI002B1EDDDA|nr:hypothetical protein [Desulfitobacterium sp.]MEA4902058.1 hypothetical protein [Desulfitobacterium sp.]